MTKKYSNIISLRLFFGFCMTELLILIVLKLTQAIHPDSVVKTLLMFSAILFNALFMLFLVCRIKKAGKPTAVWGIPLAVFVTLLADVFLVLLDDFARTGIIHFLSTFATSTLGFFFFGIVQVIYAFYMGMTKRRLVIRVAFYLAFVAALAAVGMLSLDRFIACLSMSQLIMNLIFVWIEHRKERTAASLLLALGITLFFGCDLFIMLRMLLPAQGFIYDVICFMVWIFYIPSQVLLTSSYLADRASAEKRSA